MTIPGNFLRDNDFMSPSLAPDKLHGQYVLNSLKAHYFGVEHPSCWRLIDTDDAELLHKIDSQRESHDS